MRLRHGSAAPGAGATPVAVPAALSSAQISRSPSFRITRSRLFNHQPNAGSHIEKSRSAASSAAACNVQIGLFRSSRPIATRSAFPDATTAFAVFGSQINPRTSKQSPPRDEPSRTDPIGTPAPMGNVAGDEALQYRRLNSQLRQLLVVSGHEKIGRYRRYSSHHLSNR